LTKKYPLFKSVHPARKGKEEGNPVCTEIVLTDWTMTDSLDKNEDSTFVVVGRREED
jgi:hypothetical protein